MAQSLKVLALFAHPDDAEFLCAGTLACLRERGSAIHIVTMTAGDCGSTIFPASKIAEIRRAEARRSAELIEAEYACLEEKDLLVLYDKRTLQNVIRLVRRVDPALVFTHAPVDYMVDHETTSRLCQTACFGAVAPNFSTGAGKRTNATRAVPHVYYAQPFGGRDILGNEIRSTIYVNVSTTFERKERMLACHESQQAWLRAQQSMASPLGALREMAQQAGQIAGCRWAEGFRQHLGQGYPADNLLAKLLGDLVLTSAP